MNYYQSNSYLIDIEVNYEYVETSERDGRKTVNWSEDHGSGQMQSSVRKEDCEIHKIIV